MGKSLIIPGADFSSNHVSRFDWFTSFVYDYSFDKPFVSSNIYAAGGSIVSYLGKTISKIRIAPNQVQGTALFFLFQPFELGSVELIDSLQISIPQISEILELDLPKEIRVGQNQFVGIKISSSGVLMYKDHTPIETIHYSISNPDVGSFTLYVDETATSLLHGIDFGGY